MILSLGFRNALRRKSRAAIIIMAIALSSSLYTGLNILHSSAIYSVINAYTDYLGDFDILITNSENPFFNETYVESQLTNLNIIDTFSPRLISFGFIPTTGVPFRTIMVGINQTLDQGIGEFEFVEGSKEVLSGNKVYVLLDLAEAFGLTPGKNLTIYTINSTGDIISVSLTVACVVKQHGKLPVSMREAVFLDLKFLQNITGFKDKVNFVFVKLANIDLSNIDTAVKTILNSAETIQEALGFDFNVVPIKASVMDLVSKQVQSFVAILQVFASLTLLMTIILVFAATNMNLNDRIKEIGIIRSIGGGRKEILLMFLAETFVYGILGGVIGLLSGYLIFGSFLVELFLPNPIKKYVKIPFTIETVSISFSLGVFASIIGSIYAIYAAMKITPAEALTPQARRVKLIESIRKKFDPSEPFYAMISSGVIIFLISSFLLVFLPVVGFYGDIFLIFSAIFAMILLSLLGIVLVLIGITPKLIDKIRKIGLIKDKLSVILSSINFLRTKRRGILGLLMIALSVSAIVNLGFTMEAQKIDITNSIRVSQGSDIVIYCNEPIPYNSTRLLDNVSGIEAYTPVTVPLPATIGDLIMWETSKVNIYGVNPESYLNASYVREFNQFDPNFFKNLGEIGTVVISTGLASKLDVSIGDKVRIEYLHKTLVLRVVGILDVIPGFVFTRFEQRANNLDLLVSIDTYKNLTSQEIPLVGKIMVKPAAGVNYGDLISRINKNLGSLYDIQVVATESIIEDNIQSLSQFESILSSILYFSIIVAILGHITMIVASIYERLWEISILRAMGASRTQILSIYLLEAILLAVIGYIIGILSAFIIFLENTIANNLTSEIPRPLIILPSNIIVYTLLAVTIPATIIAYALIKRFTGINIAETIRRSSNL